MCTFALTPFFDDPYPCPKLGPGLSPGPLAVAVTVTATVTVRGPGPPHGGVLATPNLHLLVAGGGVSRPLPWGILTTRQHVPLLSSIFRFDAYGSSR